MTFLYVYRENEPPVGPYSPEQLRAGLAAGVFRSTDMAGYGSTGDQAPLEQILAANLPKRCPQCESELSFQIEYPNKGTGVIVIVLGVLFAPFCIGIPILIWGVILCTQTRYHWHCRGCGRVFPV